MVLGVVLSLQPGDSRELDCTAEWRDGWKNARETNEPNVFEIVAREGFAWGTWIFCSVSP
jgi:hypothetical protein